MDPDKRQDYWPQRQENDQFIKQRQYAGRAKKERCIDWADQVEAQAQAMVEEKLPGWKMKSTPHRTSPYDYDLVAPDGRVIRLEVKASAYYKLPDKRSGRYQAKIHHPNVDVVLFLCQNGRLWPFLIPIEKIGRRTNIAIWSEKPGQYRGQWAEFLENWQVILEALEEK